MANVIKTDHQKEIINLIMQAAYSQGVYQVFNDFLELSAISISNSVDPVHYAAREKRYLDIIGQYEKKHQQLFPLMFFHLVEALEEKVKMTGPEDVLGIIFHSLELHNKYRGQFFTPIAISDCMAQITMGDEIKQGVEEKGFFTLCEPTCGSGVMAISACKAMSKLELNYCSQLVITAIDCDLKCAHMAYIQLSLYGVPAVVIHGDSLLVKEYSRWYTPIYLKNGWIWRTHCGMTDGNNAADENMKCALEPTYAAFRLIMGMTGDMDMSGNADTPNNTAIGEIPITADTVTKPNKPLSKKNKSERHYEPIQPSLFD